MSADITVRLLADGDPVDRFDCAADELNRWLRRHALDSAALDSARTHVALTPDGEIAGYIALTGGSVAHRDAPASMTAGMPRYALPVVLLARLAVDRGHEGQGIAAGLVRLGMEITVETAERIGVRGLAVDALDDEAAVFYERFGFARAAPESLKLQIPTRTLRAALRPAP